MGMKNVTISLPQDEYDQLSREAQEPPYSGTLTDMCRAVLRGRHDMVVQPSVDAERMKSFYEGQLALLKADKEDLLNRLSASDKSNGLAGVDGREKSVGRQISEAVEKVKADLEQKTLKEKYDTAVEQNRLLTEKNKELEKEVDELEDKVSTDARIQSYAQTGQELLMGFVNGSPAAQARFEQGGLAGLWGSGGAVGSLEIGGGSLSEEQQSALAIGMSIRKEFTGDRYQLIVNTLRYLRDNPGVLKSLTSSPKFAAYVGS